MGKKIAKVILGIVLVILLAALAYLAYVMLSYHRIEDPLALTVRKGADGSGASEDVLASGQPLRVTSYNIGFGAYSPDFDFFMDGGTHSWAFSEEAARTNVAGAASVIADIDPDLALFQEVDFDATRSYHVDEREIVTEGMTNVGSTAAGQKFIRNYDHISAQNYDSPFLFYPFTEPHGRNRSCIMTFSSAPIIEAVRRSVPIETGFSKFLDLDRCYSKSRIPVDNGKELVLYNLHFSAYTSSSDTAENQLRQLVADMTEEYEAGNYCIAGGDFNRDLLGNSPEIFHTEVLEDNWAKPIPMEIFTDDITLVAPFNEDEPAATCRDSGSPMHDGMFVVTLDGFVVSANVEPQEAHVIDTQYLYSDHNPVYMDFVLKK